MATVKKFKLNKVVEPFTEEEFNSFYHESCDYQCIYCYYDGYTYDNKPDDVGFDITAENPTSPICAYDYKNEKGYYYIFENILDDYGVSKVGWYEEKYDDDDNELYIPISKEVVFDIIIEATQPEDWDADENGEWRGPWITSYFYKVLTEIVEEPKEPIEITYKIKRSTLVDIANAIREKTGKTDLIKVSDLDDAVKELSAGGGGGSSKIIDAPASMAEPPVGCKPHDIIRLYEEFDDTSVIVGRQNGPLPMGNQGYRVSDVVFNTNTPDEEVLEAFKSVFPDLDYAYSNRKDRHYFFYNNSADYIMLGIGLVSPDDDTTLSLYIKATRGNGLSSNIWECYVNKTDYSIVSGGRSWATSFAGYESEQVTVGDGVITVHFKDKEALSNDPGDTGASGTFAETFYPIISTERIEYGKKREYVVMLYVNEDGTFTELVSKQ